MITFINLGLFGRLGNQLFQYATLKATALRNGYECAIPDISNAIWHSQKCLLPQFNINARTVTPEEINGIKYFIDEFTHSPGYYYGILESIHDNTSINGHFQHTKYFIDFKDEILKEFTLKQEILQREQKYIDSIKEGKYHLVSLHIRRGDLVDQFVPGNKKLFGQNYLPKSCGFYKYITTAMSHYANRDDVRYLVFTGGSRSGDDAHDIRLAKEYFQGKVFIVSDSNDAITDFARMSLCDDNIMAFNSTFSWWAAFLNRNPNKQVICPINFYIVSRPQQGFYPTDWIQI
jgi:hypothetical protein